MASDRHEARHDGLLGLLVIKLLISLSLFTEGTLSMFLRY